MSMQQTLHAADRRGVRPLATLGTVVAVAALLATLAGCNKNSLQQPGSAGPTDEARSTGEPFGVVVESPGGKVAEQLVTSVKVVPRGGYKINLEYPHRLKVSGPAGATPREVDLKAGQAKVTEKELVFKPTFTLAAAGEHAFAGTLRFSVCTEKQCEIKAEKVKWAVQVTAK